MLLCSISLGWTITIISFLQTCGSSSDRGSSSSRNSRRNCSSRISSSSRSSRGSRINRSSRPTTTQRLQGSCWDPDQGGRITHSRGLTTRGTAVGDHGPRGQTAGPVGGGSGGSGGRVAATGWGVVLYCTVLYCTWGDEGRTVLYCTVGVGTEGRSLLQAGE